MIRRWPVYTTKKADKLHSRTVKGVPDCVRGVVWKLLAAAGGKIERKTPFPGTLEPADSSNNGSSSHTKHNKQEGIVPSNVNEQVEALKPLYQQCLQKKSQWTTQIDLDVNRAARNRINYICTFCKNVLIVGRRNVP